MRISDWSSDVCSSDLNLSAYAPIFAAYGPGTNSDARLQISFKFQIFSHPAAPDRRQSWEQGIHFAYTHRMFWDMGAKSSHFRNIDFMPELFYLSQPMAFRSAAAIDGQCVCRHEVTGRLAAGSRRSNKTLVQ